MQKKIYKARFFSQDSGVEITLDEAQSISETGRLTKILFHFIHSELMMLEGWVKGNIFTTIDGYSLLVKTEDNHLYLKNQEYDLPFYFGYASEYRGNMFIQSFSDFPSFHKHLQELKRKNEISKISEYRHLIRRENLSEYRYLISGKFKSRKGFSVTKIIPISFEMDDIEGNIITDKTNSKFKVIGTASFVID